MFRSFRTPHVRIFFAGQFPSMIGMWVQSTALYWFVLRLTDSALALGVLAAFDFGPMLLLSMWGGGIADRLSKRVVLVATQSAMACLALALGLMAATGEATLWPVYAVTLLTGCAFAVDNPTRRAFLGELVAPGNLSNAVSLWNALSATSRVIGPALAGLLIANIDVAVCFFVNAVSYLAAIAALVSLSAMTPRRRPPAARNRGALRAALRYAWHEHDVRIPLIMMAAIGTLSFNFEVLLPLLARSTFHRGAQTFGVMMAFTSIGFVIGSLLVATRPRVSGRYVAMSALSFGILMLLVATSGSLVATFAALVAMGVGASAFISSSNAVIQVACDPTMSGRVMALFSALFLGTTPIGGPVLGGIAGAFGPRAGLAVGGLTALLAGTAALFWYSRVSSRRRNAVGQEPRSIGRAH